MVLVVFDGPVRDAPYFAGVLDTLHKRCNVRDPTMSFLGFDGGCLPATIASAAIPNMGQRMLNGCKIAAKEQSSGMLGRVWPSWQSYGESVLRYVYSNRYNKPGVLRRVQRRLFLVQANWIPPSFEVSMEFEDREVAIATAIGGIGAWSRLLSRWLESMTRKMVMSLLEDGERVVFVSSDPSHASAGIKPATALGDTMDAFEQGRDAAELFIVDHGELLPLFAGKP